MSFKDNFVGTTYVAGGGYLAYKGLEHGLPRALGIRTEYHTTSKENAKLIEKAGNILDPAFGGKNGWSSKVDSYSYIRNSKGYIHITGANRNGLEFKEACAGFREKFPAKFKKLADAFEKILPTLYRKTQCIMYKTVGNGSNIAELMYLSKKEKTGKLLEIFKNNIFKNQTKRFCIPGIDSYFAKEFIEDCDDMALKSSKRIKAYTNRFSAMMAGLKEFGLKGIKENKSRVIVGLSIVALSTFGAYKLIRKGINRFQNNNQDSVENK